jgi:hypothetical protein
MDHTALLALTVVCFVVAVAAELAGVALAVSEVRRASRALRRWRNADPGGNDQGADLEEVVRALLGKPFDRVSAVVLVLVGIGTGALGNFLSLGV